MVYVGKRETSKKYNQIGFKVLRDKKKGLGRGALMISILKTFLKNKNSNDTSWHTVGASVRPIYVFFYMLFIFAIGSDLSVHLSKRGRAVID
jgi:hypothetical protein